MLTFQLASFNLIAKCVCDALLVSLDYRTITEIGTHFMMAGQDTRK